MLSNGQLVRALHNGDSSELADTMGRLRGQLAERAEADGVLDIAYRTLDTPVGLLLLAATTRGLVRIAYQQEDHNAVLAKVAQTISPRVLCAPARLDDVAKQLDEYFTGSRRHFDITIDVQLAHGFRATVLRHLTDIPYGSTASYAAVARATGNPRAVRAVGSACATNPLPVVVPCHRVVRSDGSIGGYLGGAAAKQALLRLEAV